MRNLFKTSLRLATLAVALVISACGGGSSSLTNVSVMGDSLSDSGVYAAIPGFGRVFSVQGSDSEPNTIWTERIAARIGTQPLCNYYVATPTSYTLNPKAGCSSYGVGAARINNPASRGGANVPLSIPKQLADAAARVGSYARGELLLIDGGGNDAADLVGAFLNSARDGGASYAALLSTLLMQTTVNATLSQPNGAATAGAMYMTALADMFYTAIKTNTLERGAEHVAVLNMPDITHTPRFQAALDAVAAANGGGAAGAAARAQAQALFGSWVQAFNLQLGKRFAGDNRVVVVDFYAAFNDQIANPAKYGLTNVKTPACPVTGIGNDGLPSYNFQTCTAAALSANPPTGQSGADWWKRYLFSDGFHPTPYGYQLLSEVAWTAIGKAGWL